MVMKTKSGERAAMVEPEQTDIQHLMQSIEEFYLPKHLVQAIYAIGRIPDHSSEGLVGVGFIDIADYTRLSRYLSPKENQILLNGLYTAFAIVLERHGGFLNKIEGDAMMFHFDDIIDKRMWDIPSENRSTFIARELFYTCIDMQRVCILFNEADDRFLDETASEEAKLALSSAFDIIQTLRKKNDIASALSAFFQIRIRIGANIGEVMIGNFGPDGAKHWDVIGLPVINAKRMEATAPIGGLRISAEFFEILKANGIADEYYTRFREDARRAGSTYSRIKWDDLFKYREVTLLEKRNAVYKTYSVQVFPELPESIANQAEALIKQGPNGVGQILEFFRYYRGNRYVIDCMEARLARMGIQFRKQELVTYISPRLAKKVANGAKVSLYRILNYMDQYLDYVKAEPDPEERPKFLSYDQYITRMRAVSENFYDEQKRAIVQKTWFSIVVVQMVYASLEASILEYQQSESAEENLDELEAVESETEGDALMAAESRDVQGK